MAETNQLLLNYYKKEEIKKIQQLSKEEASLKTILRMVDLKYYLTKEQMFYKIYIKKRSKGAIEYG